MSSNEVKLSTRAVAQLATTAGISVEKLLNKLQEANIKLTSPEQPLSPQAEQKEKIKLLGYLKNKPTSTTSATTTNRDYKPQTSERTETNTSTLQRPGSNKVTIKRKAKKVLIHDPIEEPTPIETNTSTAEPMPVQEPSTVDIETPAESTPVIEEPVTASTPAPAIEEETPEVEITSAQSNDRKPAYTKEKSTYNSAKPNKFTKPNKKGKKNNYTQTAQHTKPGRTRDRRIETGLKQAFEKPTAPITREINIPESISVTELAQKMSIKAAEVIKQLIQMGIRATINQSLEQDVAILLVEEMGHVAKPLANNPLELELQDIIEKNIGEETTRPPIVTIMGHVDHGKTSLLDYIRRTKVASKEAGGITQHIGAYHVNIPKGILTFLDTPGHAAFTAMRARGARLTDMVILVVAADDGVMPQTIEAIQHAKAANVPIVVAINKMDKPNATVERAQQELAKHELISEEWGGDTQFIPVSAKTGMGIDELLNSLLIQAEMLELKAPTAGPAQGIIIESRREKGRGSVATILVQRGTLSKGDILLAGTSFGRIRALHDETGKLIKSAGPSIPAEILGLSDPPTAGDEAIVVANERKAREIAFARSASARESKLKSQRSQHMADILRPDSANRKTLYVILKADVQGSAEALNDALIKLSTDEINVKPLAASIGAITESDVNLALASKAVLLGFNVRADNIARQLVERENVIMHYHTIIYELIDQVKQMMTGMLEPIIQEKALGLATVREIFRSAKTGTIAGCYVTEGRIQRGYPIRILRNNVIVYQSKHGEKDAKDGLHSLRRFKDDVNEVRMGTECGISLKNYTDLQPGDIIENYERVTVARTL